MLQDNLNIGVLELMAELPKRVILAQKYIEPTLAREFLELDAELPKSNQTAALSGKNMMKMISKVGDRVSAYTTKMEETDTWFEEKTVTVENLDNQLRKLHVATEAMVEYRKTLSGHTYSLSKSLAMLGSAEDNSKLSAALAQLADVEEKVEKVHEQQAKDDFYLMSELVRDYVGIVGSVREAFQVSLQFLLDFCSMITTSFLQGASEGLAELARCSERP